MKISPAHRVLLIGFMGSGKSTVGRELAEQLGWHFEDIDEAITHDAGMSIAEIFQDPGESFFRLEEHRKTREILNQDEVVIATGGGWAAVPGSDGLEILRTLGLCLVAQTRWRKHGTFLKNARISTVRQSIRWTLTASQ